MAAVENDDSVHLPDSLQLEAGKQAALTWAVLNADSVELTGPDGSPQSITDGSTSLVVTPPGDVNDYSLVALAGQVRSAPSVVHVSTHAAGDCVSPHADVSPPTPPAISAFLAAPKDNSTPAAQTLAAQSGDTVTLSWTLAGAAASLQIDNGVGDVLALTTLGADGASYSGQTDVAVQIPDGQTQVVYTLSAGGSDGVSALVTATVTVGAVAQDDESVRYDWVKRIITSTLVRDWRKDPQGTATSGPAILGNAIFDTGAMDMNVLGIRGWLDGTGPTEDIQNTWCDTFYVAYLDAAGKKHCETFLSTTDPGLQNLSGGGSFNSKGIAHLLDNQCRFYRGRHNRGKDSERDANQQGEPFFVWRSGKLEDQHNDYRPGTDLIDFGLYGINNHDSGVSETSKNNKKVGNSSEGCQVLHGNRHQAAARRYFWLCNQDNDGVIRYTLRDSKSLGADADVKYAKLQPDTEATKKLPDQLAEQNLDPNWKQHPYATAYKHFDRFFDDTSGPYPGDDKPPPAKHKKKK